MAHLRPERQHLDHDDPHGGISAPPWRPPSRKLHILQADVPRLTADNRFDPYHASAPYACGIYGVRAVDLASSTHSRVVLDIGCGLGDIIGRVRAEKRWGVDKSAAAIAAARRLFGGRVSFAVGSAFAPDEIAKVVSDRPIDLLIMTGWTYMELEKLVATIRSIQQKLSVRMLLIDTLRPGALEGRLAHSVEDLKRLGEVRVSVDCGDGVIPRDLHLIALTP